MPIFSSEETTLNDIWRTVVDLNLPEGFGVTERACKVGGRENQRGVVGKLLGQMATGT